MYLCQMTNSANQKSSYNHEAEHMASIKLPTVAYSLVYMAYEVQISCKGPFSTVLYIFATTKTNFKYIFVYILRSALV